MQSKIDLIIAEIKKKKSVSAVKDEFILKEINKILAQNKKVREKIETASLDKVSKSKEFKTIVKEVRAVLHRSHGQYQNDDVVKREKYLNELKEIMAKPDGFAKIPPTTPAGRPVAGKILNTHSQSLFSQEIINLHSKILSTNVSAKERLGIYPTIYSDIFAITGKPESILDLGSGINPVSFPFMNLPHVKYTALELSKKDCDFLIEYFAIMNEFIEGHAESIDLVEINKNPSLLSKLSADMAFLFKVIEPIELSKSHKIGETIMKNLDCKWIIVSFATTTISGNRMNYPKRRWFEMMIHRLGYELKSMEKENEIFYIIKK